MAGRRPGTAPIPTPRHTAPDPFLRAGDGWTEISTEPYSGPVPEIPDWVRVGPDARRVYMTIATLPQAATWGAGTWLELHLSLPLIEKYLTRPGSESFKALVSALGAGLSLTELDMQRARIQAKAPQADDDENGEVLPAVARISDRRKRLS
jgi:hypothetical protein